MPLLRNHRIYTLFKANRSIMEATDKLIVDRFFGKQPQETDAVISPFVRAKSQLEFTLNQDKAAPLSSLIDFNILAIADLLSLCITADLKHKKTSNRLKQFLQTQMKCTATEAYYMYKYRNALVHTCGNYAFDDRREIDLRFYSDNEIVTLLAVKGRSTILVNTQKLVERLFLGIESTYQLILSDKTVFDNFLKINKKFGFISLNKI